MFLNILSKKTDSLFLLPNSTLRRPSSIKKCYPLFFAQTYSTTNSTHFTGQQHNLKRQDLIKNKCISYIQLMRAHKPIGVWLLYWPCTWSIAITSSDVLPDIKLLTLFAIGAFFMRSAGCILNDLWDKDFDKKVERTKSRPLATGKISEKEAVLLLAVLLSSSLAILLQLNTLSILIGASSLWLVAAYPLAKRYTYWPQLLLGATFNWGALLGFTAASNKFLPEICIPLYLACICWTMVYDTIYAHQDKQDDVLIGLKSTAIKFGDKTQHWLSGFSFGMIANLTLVGLNTGQLWPFYTALIASSMHLGWQTGTIKTESADDCWNKFYSNQWIGAAILTGIVLSNLLKHECEQQMTGEDNKETDGDNLEKFVSNLEQRNMNVNFYT